MAGPSSPNRLSQLRAQAQQHLTEIEADKLTEEAQQAQAEADIQRYAKVSSLDRKQQIAARLKLTSTSPSGTTELQSTGAQSIPTAAKGGRFTPFNEVLHRIKWDPDLDIREYIVGFLERFEGMKEMPASNWIRDFSEEEWIPMHRVRYVKRVRVYYNGEDKGPAMGIVWDRDARIDKISKVNAVYDAESQAPEDLSSIDGTSVTGGMSL